MSIAADQQRLVQWAEEKVALASTCADLLEWHSQKLTREIKAFDFELKVILHQGCACHILTIQQGPDIQSASGFCMPSCSQLARPLIMSSS